MRIAQIKFYQQLGFSIKEITMIIDAPDTEIKKALEYRVQKLKDEKTEMDELIERANQMIARLSKEAMNKDNLTMALMLSMIREKTIIGLIMKTAITYL